jgi:polysaccharide deacetylase 2 family uncharacterized protein YibQ
VPKTAGNRSKKKPQNAKKRRKKGVSPDIGHAIALTAVLIGVSVIISIAVIGIRSSTPATLATEEIIETSPDNPPVPDKSPLDEIAAVTTLPEKNPTEMPPVKSAPVKTTPSQPLAPKTQIPKETKSPPELPPQPKHRGTLVFIIDDAGNNLQELEPFLRFSGPLTIAVLPGLPHSAEAARRIRAAGKEVFLHQPMEAVGGQNPGPGAIYAGMNAAEIVAILSKNIAEIGPVAGMNNHQGSKITMDQQMMETVLGFCREQGIIFVDSRTSAETAVPAAAQKLGIKIGERNIFIDNDQNRPAMNRSIEGGLARASQAGSALMIGHTWSPELAPLLADMYQDLIAQGYEVVTAGEFITNK